MYFFLSPGRASCFYQGGFYCACGYPERLSVDAVDAVDVISGRPVVPTSVRLYLVVGCRGGAFSVHEA